jgi:hypothetical protein
MYIVYLISAEINGKVLYKIGWTKRTPEQRIKEFKTGNVSEFLVIESYKSEWGSKIEVLLHKKYNKYKISGEWFDLPENEVKNFYLNCDIIHDNLDLIANNNTYYLDKGGF